MDARPWKIISFEEVSSTNDVAQQYSGKKMSFRAVIWAKRQTHGRGRNGHSWQSLEDNLFFSIITPFPLQHLGQLVILSTLSLWRTIYNLNTNLCLELKWPNDILLNKAKVSGI